MSAPPDDGRSGVAQQTVGTADEQVAPRVATRAVARRTTLPRQRILAVAGGAAGFGAAWVLRATGVLSGPLALAVVALALLLLPTSRELSRRILLNGLVALGWVQVLWWWPLPFERMAPVVALVVGGGVASAVWHLAGGGAVRTVFGRIRGVDVLPPLTFGVGLFATLPWLTPRTGSDALSVLITGWDNSGHFDMFRMVWSHGRTIDTLPAAAGQGQWHYDNYPQGFHSTLVSLADVMWPGAINDVGASLMAYTRSVALAVALAVAVLVAGLCSLPTVRRRPEVAAPLAAVVAAAVLLGQGQELLDSGFAAFLFPCILASASVFVALLAPRVASPVHVLAFGGAVAGVAHGWLPLLVVMLPVAAALILPFRGSTWRASPRRWVLSALAVVASGYAVLRAWRILVDHGAGAESLTQPGGIIPPPIGTSLTVLIGAMAAALVAAAALWRPGAARRRVSWRLLALATTPIASVAALAFIAKLQVAANGQVGYYLWKLLAGVGFVAVAVAAAALASLARPRSPWRSAAMRRGVVAGAALGALGLTQLFGYFGPSFPDIGLVSTDRATTARHQFGVAAEGFRSDAEALLSAVAVPVDDPFRTAYIQDPTTGHLNPINAQQWFLSLHGSWTRAANFQSAELAQGQATVADAVVVAETWLAQHPGQVVATPSLSAALTGSDTSNRVLTWG